MLLELLLLRLSGIPCIILPTSEVLSIAQTVLPGFATLRLGYHTLGFKARPMPIYLLVKMYLARRRSF